MLDSYRKKGAYTRPDHLMRELVDFSHMLDDHHNTSLFQPGHMGERIAYGDASSDSLNPVSIKSRIIALAREPNNLSSFAKSRSHTAMSRLNSSVVYGSTGCSLGGLTLCWKADFLLRGPQIWPS